MKSLFIIFIALTIYSSSFSQDSSYVPKYALSFGIADNFTLKNFNMDIAVKKIFDNTNQLRLFLSPRISKSNQDVTTNAVNQSREEERWNYSLGIGADYLWTIIANDDISLFSGTGLVISYGRNYNKSSIGDNENNTTTEMKAPSASAGVRGILGVEWKVNKNIGIHCEYLVAGYYSWNKTENSVSQMGSTDINTTIITTGISLGSNVLFGLSIYF
jgi:hypothetical protein